MGKTVTYSCSLVPCELILAAGLQPSRIAPALGTGLRALLETAKELTKS